MSTIVLRRHDPITAETTVRAAPEHLHAIVSDVTRIPEWSPECHTCTVLGEGRFRGSNRRRLARWSTEARVVVDDPSREFSFVVESVMGDFTRWTYRVRPGEAAGTSVLTEEFVLLVDLPRALVLYERFLLGVRDRRTDLAQNLARSLARIRAIAEREVAAGRPGSPTPAPTPVPAPAPTRPRLGVALLARPVLADPVARVVGAAAALGGRLRRDAGAARAGSAAGVSTTRVRVPTRHGEVACTVHRRSGTPASAPVHVNVHGGGFVIAFPEQDDRWCRHLAARTGVVVVSPDYATAPRARFPIAVEQVHDVLAWVAAGTGEPGDRAWDGRRVAIGGQSAGGNLAAAAARLARTTGPAIALQVLHYPVLDLVTPPADKPTTRPRGVPPWWLSTVFDTAYLPLPAQRRDPLASPAWGTNADDLAGVAPAVVVTADHDRLRAEGTRYAAALASAGALVEHVDVPGVGHGYDILDEDPATTAAMHDRLADHLARALGVD